MTRVCLVGSEDVDLRAELLSRQTAREALSTYQLERPFENALALRTISIGAAISLLNDLNWYLVRFTNDALVQEPSVSEDEWLSRSLATAIRDGELEPEDAADTLKIYGVENGTLVEPMFAQRVADAVPSYDLRDVEETLITRVTEDEYGN